MQGSIQQTDANAELLRLYYLQQLGITAYVPRVDLAGALVVEPVMDDAGGQGVDEHLAEQREEIAHEVELAKATAVEKPAIVVEPEPVLSKSTLARPPVIEDTPAVTPPPRKVEKVEVAPQVTPEQAMSPFQILVTVVSAELAVAVQIPSAMKPALREADARLLGNVMRWLGYSWPTQTAPLHFRWPLPGLPATGAEQAGKGLQVFLHQAQQEQRFRHLLVFGGEPAAALRANENSGATWQTWSTHSLAEMLALPELKREAWQALIPLKAQLSS